MPAEQSRASPESPSTDLPSWWRKTAIVVLVAAVCLGLAVRVRQYLAAPSFWYDEAYVLVNIANKTCASLCGPLRCDQAAPPLFLWTLRLLYLWGGAPEWLMRLPAFLASVASLLVIIPLGRMIAGRWGWVWAVGLCALSHHAVTHAVEVKPYTFDLLLSELILLAAASLLAKPESGWRLSALLAVAALGPWLSYPSVFLVAGASLALAADAWQRRSKAAWLGWAGLNAIAALSTVAVWLVAARYQRTDSLEAYWRSAFVDLSSPLGAIFWGANLLVKAGNYASTSLGIPLALLSLWGVATAWRRSRPVALLLIGPALAALAANALRRYPLEDRLLFFAAPCIWLVAAVGAGDLVERLRGWQVRFAVLALIAMLLPGAIRSARHLAVVRPKAEFREAFRAVSERRQTGDLWWVSHPEMAEVYLGHICMGTNTPAEVVARTVAGRRVWVVAGRPEKGPLLAPELSHGLELAGMEPQTRLEFRTVVVFLFTPSPVSGVTELQER